MFLYFPSLLCVIFCPMLKKPNQYRAKSILDLGVMAVVLYYRSAVKNSRDLPSLRSYRNYHCSLLNTTGRFRESIQYHSSGTMRGISASLVPLAMPLRELLLLTFALGP